MIPLTPSLQPTVMCSLCIELDGPRDDEAEIRYLEKEHHSWLMSVQHVASDLTPIGGLPQAAGEPADTDDEGGIEDSDDSDSRDEEEDDDEMDAIDANIANTNNSAVTIDTSSPDIFNQPQYQ